MPFVGSHVLLDSMLSCGIWVGAEGPYDRRHCAQTVGFGDEATANSNINCPFEGMPMPMPHPKGSQSLCCGLMAMDHKPHWCRLCPSALMSKAQGACAVLMWRLTTGGGVMTPNGRANASHEGTLRRTPALHHRGSPAQGLFAYPRRQNRPFCNGTKCCSNSLDWCCPHRPSRTAEATGVAGVRRESIANAIQWPQTTAGDSLVLHSTDPTFVRTGGHDNTCHEAVRPMFSLEAPCSACVRCLPQYRQ